MTSSTAMKESVYHEMVQQLKGEKMRVMELSKKINELHSLEEEQRQRARVLADERDRYALRSIQVEFSNLPCIFIWQPSFNVRVLGRGNIHSKGNVQKAIDSDRGCNICLIFWSPFYSLASPSHYHPMPPIHRTSPTA